MNRSQVKEEVARIVGNFPLNSELYSELTCNLEQMLFKALEDERTELAEGLHHLKRLQTEALTGWEVKAQVYRDDAYGGPFAALFAALVYYLHYSEPEAKGYELISLDLTPLQQYWVNFFHGKTWHNLNHLLSNILNQTSLMQRSVREGDLESEQLWQATLKRLHSQAAQKLPMDAKSMTFPIAPKVLQHLDELVVTAGEGSDRNTVVTALIQMRRDQWESKQIQRNKLITLYSQLHQWMSRTFQIDWSGFLNMPEASPALEADWFASSTARQAIYFLRSGQELTPLLIGELQEQLHLFRQLDTAYSDQTLYGIILYERANVTEQWQAWEAGFYLIELAEESLTLRLPDGFQPQPY